MNRMSGILALLALSLMLMGATVIAAEDFKSVTPEELKSNPKQYWLTGVIFKDVLSAYPAGSKIRIADEDFIAFRTKTLGTCYADMPLVATMATQPLDREYLFRGTVLTRHRDFYVIVRSAAASFEKLDGEKATLLESVAAFQPGTANQADDPLNALLAEAYKSYFTYAEETGIDVQQLFNRNSNYEEKLLFLIGEATRRVEREKKTTAPAILNRVILEILAARYGQESAAEPVAGMPPVQKSAPAAGPAPVKPAVAQPPEFDPAVFILKSGVGKRPLPAPPAGTNAPAATRAQPKAAVPAVPVKATVPVAVPAVKAPVTATSAPPSAPKRRSISLWSKPKATVEKAAPLKPEPVRAAPNSGLNAPVGR